MLLADRGFANHELMVATINGTMPSAPCDVLLHGTSRYQDSWLVVPTVGRGLLVSVGLWVDGTHRLQSCGGNGLARTRELSSLMRRRVYKRMDQMQVTL